MSDNDRLSQIPTLWSVVRQAAAGQSVDSRPAQQQLIDRYGGAIQRYLLGALRNQSAADDAYQEFVVRFLQGDYDTANPDRGRFRSFLKTILYRLVVEHYRGLKRRRTPQLGSEFPELAVINEQVNDQAFQQSWCDEIMKRAWNALKLLEDETGRPVFTVLRGRVDNPGLNSTQLAEQVSEDLAKPVSTATIRVMLHRSRDKFAQLLLDEVAETLDDPTPLDIEQELSELGLLEYCRPALKRRNEEQPHSP